MAPAGRRNAWSSVFSGPVSSRCSAGMPAALARSRSPTHPNANSPFRYLAVAAGGSRAPPPASNWSTSTGGGSTIPVTTNVEFPAGLVAPVCGFIRANRYVTRPPTQVWKNLASCVVSAISPVASRRGNLPATTVARSCRKNSPSRLPCRASTRKESSAWPLTTGSATRPSQARPDTTPGRCSICRMEARAGPGTLTVTSLALIEAR